MDYQVYLLMIAYVEVASQLTLETPASFEEYKKTVYKMGNPQESGVDDMLEEVHEILHGCEISEIQKKAHDMLLAII
jgi:hypothetical protein